jgi:hypothetical protein
MTSRATDALALYARRPHMYKPTCRSTGCASIGADLVLWGSNDRIVTPDYGRAYAR